MSIPTKQPCICPLCKSPVDQIPASVLRRLEIQHEQRWDICVDGGPHRYPQIWSGTIPPNCELCGRRSA